MGHWSFSLLAFVNIAEISSELCPNSKMASKFTIFFPILLALLSCRAASKSIVRSLPGLSGPLPFTLETGYTSVGDVEFFYYFVESLNNPAADPVLVYFNGGPGCSGLNGLFYQIGPLQFDTNNYTGGIPTILYEPSAWTKTANVIFLDFPVGAGFSYSTTTAGWNTSDIKSAAQASDFLRNWLSDHPDFQTNPVYLGSDSYAGIIIPILARDIIDGNTGGLEPFVNLKGYAIGCPHTDELIEENSKIPFAYRLTLLSDGLYEAAKTNCNGTYVNYDETNTECVSALDAINECVKLLSLMNILEPNCDLLSPQAKEDVARRSLGENPRNDLLLPSSAINDLYCHNSGYLLLDIWGSYTVVQDALHVRPGTVGEYHRCNISTSGYTVDMNNVVPFHENLTNTGLQVLVFSGDHDMVIPHNGIEEWIASFDLAIDTDWRAWFVNGQVAGYTRRYSNDGYRLTYATVKGAGHSPQEYKRQECYEMFHRWIHHYPL